MRKLMMFLCLTIFVGITNGQTLRVSLVDEFSYGETKVFCADTVTIYVDSTCEWTMWCRPDFSESFYSYELTVTESQYQGSWRVTSDECMINMEICVYITSPESNAFNPFDEPFIWKHPDDTITLGNPELNYLEWLWSTDETSTTIDVVQDGTYSATNVNDPCGPRTYSIDVYNTPELTASCDLATGYNMLEWETNAEQATYVVSLNIYLDYDENCINSELIATVDYNAGSYIDTGHDSWQSPCQYHAVPVMANGEEAPLRSYWVRTISLFDLMGTQGLQQLQWTPYVTERDNAKNITSVLAYKIFDVVNGEASYRATVGSFATSYNYDPSQFNGHAAVAAQLNNGAKDELLAYSRTQYKIGDPDGLEEDHKATFAVYPNPATGGVINIQAVDGDHNLTITNVMGQVVYSGVIKGGFTSTRLTPGVYAVQCNGSTQKVVVE